jgi:hypothetical protein
MSRYSVHAQEVQKKLSLNPPIKRKDFLTALPSDLLRLIVSFLVYTPDTARLSRVNRTLDRTPRLYPSSAHRYPHDVHLPRVECYFLCYYRDGIATQPFFASDDIFLHTSCKIGNNQIRSLFNRETGKLEEQSEIRSNDGALMWFITLCPNGNPMTFWYRVDLYDSVCVERINETNKIHLKLPTEQLLFNATTREPVGRHSQTLFDFDMGMFFGDSI